MTLRPDVRLHLYFAAQANVAVILLRMEKLLFRLIKWNTTTNGFEDGQWLKAPVRPENCGVSSDGSYFIYSSFSRNPEGDFQGYFTAISRPPYFTALHLFPEKYEYLCGGRFHSNTLFELNHYAEGTDLVDATDLKRVQRGEKSKDCKTGLRLMNGQPAPLSRDLRLKLLGEGTHSQGRIRYDPEASKDQRLDRYDTMDGCLWSRTGGDLELIRDFRGMTFTPIQAPYSDEISLRRPEAWHPLKDEK